LQLSWLEAMVLDDQQQLRLGRVHIGRERSERHKGGGQQGDDTHGGGSSVSVVRMLMRLIRICKRNTTNPDGGLSGSLAAMGGATGSVDDRAREADQRGGSGDEDD